ncbi:cation:proton antiporter [Kitasatospora sp. NPDC097691]|uniref:cation:proton antiporter domain-containing protein n=1 Tax=Kitasatospora sp. NPDC097691 TaxID=3157231 RepID=UPI00331DE1FC
MTSHQLVLFFFGLAVSLGFARVCGLAAGRLGQPAVIGEIVAGILLGPTLFHGSFTRLLFPAGELPFFNALANVGVAVFMFVVGLEFDRGLLKGRGRAAASVALGSMLLPMLLGGAVAFVLVRRHPTDDLTGFVLFMGAAMSVTAFPVLARILTDLRMQGTALGGLALTCAAASDVLAWSLLAVVVAVVGHGGSGQWPLLLFPLYLVVMFTVVRPLLRRLLPDRRAGRRAGGAAGLTTVLAGLLVSGALTEWMGLHFIFGAFTFGLVVPRDGSGRLRSEIEGGLGRIGNLLLMPVFFLVAGLKVDLSVISPASIGDLALILLVAIGGKLGGAFLAARACRIAPRESVALAALMNTRGLTELVILSVGLQLGVLDTTLYSLMVVMALVTTAMTSPLVMAVYPRRLIDRDLAERRQRQVPESADA